MKLPDPDIQTGPWEQVREGVQRNLDAVASAMPDVKNVAYMVDGTALAIQIGTTPTIVGLAAGALTTQVVGLPKALAAYRVFADVNDGGNASMMTHSIVINSSSQFTIWLKNHNTVAVNFSMNWLAAGTP